MSEHFAIASQKRTWRKRPSGRREARRDDRHQRHDALDARGASQRRDGRAGVEAGRPRAQARHLRQHGNTQDTQVQGGLAAQKACALPMLRLLNFRCSFCSNPLDETQHERMNREIKQRTRVVQVFFSFDSLTGAMCCDQDDARLASRSRMGLAR